MSEANPAPVAPGSDAAPVAPVTPPAPTAPVAPGTDPVTPPAPEAPAEEVLTPEEQAQKAEDDEWDAADEQLHGEQPKDKEPKKDEPAKPEKTAEEIAADEAAAKAKKGDEEPGNGDDTKKGDGTEEEPGEQIDPARAARIANREYTEAVAQIKSDVMKTVFANVPEFLQDADGDPIKSIEDVMALTNPRTGESFTEEEAGMWLLSAQQQFNEQKANIEKQADEIAEVNYELKDQADIINKKYGEYLKANPELRDEIWADFVETLVKHEESGTIIKMPVSLEKYYDRQLKHRVEVDTKKADDEAAAQKAADEAKAKADAEAADKKKKARQDRSDVFGSQQPEIKDQEDDEWEQAEKEVFKGRL